MYYVVLHLSNDNKKVIDRIMTTRKDAVEFVKLKNQSLKQSVDMLVKEKYDYMCETLMGMHNVDNLQSRMEEYDDVILGIMSTFYRFETVTVSDSEELYDKRKLN